MTPEEEFERYIPQATRDNHRARVESGSATWGDLGRQFAVDGQSTLARWAHHEADKAGQQTDAPRARRSTPRETAA